MIHYKLTKKDSEIYCNDGVFGVLFVLPHVSFGDHEQLPCIKIIHVDHFQTYYASHEVETITEAEFLDKYEEVMSYINDFESIQSDRYFRIDE